jgi:ATP-dependent Clp protease ATP-binding subunit ClpC
VHDRTPNIPYNAGWQQVITLSKAEAGRLGHDYIGPEHYLLGIIRLGAGFAVHALHQVQIDLNELKTNLEAKLPVGHEPNEGIYAPNAEANRVLIAAKEISGRLEHNWLGTEHLLLGLIKEEGTLASLCLREAGLDYMKAAQEVLQITDTPST